MIYGSLRSETLRQRWTGGTRFDGLDGSTILQQGALFPRAAPAVIHIEALQASVTEPSYEAPPSPPGEGQGGANIGVELQNHPVIDNGSIGRDLASYVSNFKFQILNLTMYFIATLLLLGSLLLYFKIADRYNIIDKPNERSSHQSLTIRGGGIVFSIAVLLAFILGYATWPLTLAVMLVATISFVDDIRPLSQLPRFSVHMLASLLVLYDVGLFQLPLWWIPLALFVLLGWVNIFNFMDGINGITVLYSLVAIVSFALLPIHEGELELLTLVALSCLVFGFFNVRKKAKAFAGDVGSVAMAVFLGYFMAKTLILTQNPFYLMFFMVYGIDAAITIFYRLSRKENIFQPHRTHLYQYLANELKVPHVMVSLSYAVVQLLINLFLIYGIGMESLTYLQGLSFIIMWCFIYLILRRQVTQRLGAA